MMRSKGRSRLPRIALAAVLLSAAAGAGAQAIGRLFNTPAERGQLDSVRKVSPAAAASAFPSPPGFPPAGAGQPAPYPDAGQAAFPGANQPIPYPAGNQAAPYPAGNQPAPVVGNNQPMPYPGGNQQLPATGGNQPMPYPGGNQQLPVAGGNQPMPYPGGNQQLPTGGGNQPMPYPGNNAGANPGGNPGDPPPPPPPETLVMNGVLRTSNGRSTVWLNDIPQSGRQMKVVQRAHSAPQLTVQLPSGKKVLLKPGQRYDLAEGRVKDINEP